MNTIEIVLPNNQEYQEDYITVEVDSVCYTKDEEYHFDVVAVNVNWMGWINKVHADLVHEIKHIIQYDCWEQLEKIYNESFC